MSYVELLRRGAEGRSFDEYIPCTVCCLSNDQAKSFRVSALIRLSRIGGVRPDGHAVQLDIRKTKNSSSPGQEFPKFVRTLTKFADACCNVWHAKLALQVLRVQL